MIINLKKIFQGDAIAFHILPKIVCRIIKDVLIISVLKCRERRSREICCVNGIGSV